MTMRWIKVGLVAAGLAVAAAAVSPQAGVQGCLHGPDATPEQKARRTQLVGLARAINNQQSAAMRTSKAYSADGLTLTVPEGIDVKVTADAKGYSFSIIDTTDRCRSGVFSNQEGIIYTGQALQ
jgi:hypothetical protein